MINKICSLLVLTTFAFFCSAQYEDKLELNKGVKSYENGDYKKAEQHFVNSFDKNPDYSAAIYNAGNAAYLDGNFEGAREYYNQYINTIEDNNEKAEALHNIGNSYLKNYKEKQDGKSLAESINYFKDALRNNPKDEDTRYNLSYALSQLKKQQQQNKDKEQEGKDQQDKEQEGKDQQDKEQEGKDQQDKEQEGKDQQDKEQEGKDQQDKEQEGKDQQDKEQEGKDQQDKEQEGKDQQDKNQEGKDQQDKNQEQEKKGEMSQKQIEKNLDAINNDEQKILRKVNLQKGDKKKKTKQAKDW